MNKLEIKKALVNLRILLILEKRQSKENFDTEDNFLVESIKMGILALEKQRELNELISDIKKDFNPKDSYSTRLVLEILENLRSEGK